MGSENLHSKRKNRSKDSFTRATDIRETNDLVLIICEGQKTEPYYLKSFCESIKLNTAKVEIIGLGKDPLTLVEHALEKFEKEEKYDRVFCVFDKDEHPSYNMAVQKENTLRERVKNAIPVYSITSNPCFEYWILLHYIETTRPYHKKGHKSAGEVLLAELEFYINSYQKGQRNIFQLTKDRLPEALLRAKRVSAQNKTNDTTNPSTQIFELIEYLYSIKKPIIKNATP